MRSAPLLDIIDRLDSLDVDERARNAFRRVVLEIGAAHGIKAVERCEQVDYIRRLLALRVSRATIRERIKVRYSISARQAYRVIEEAMKLRQKPQKIGTKQEEDVSGESEMED